MTAPIDAIPDISVVVCTQDRAALLRGALASLYDLATEEEFSYEVVVVDRGSTDETRQVVAAAMQESKHPLRGVVEQRTTLAVARQRGVAAARGRWIAFFADDQLADWHWLAELHRGARDKNCRVVGYSVQLALPADCQRQLDPAVQALLGESVGGDLPQRYGGPVVPGSNLMIERDVLEKIGRETAPVDSGDGPDLYFAIEQAGIDAWFIPTAIVHQLTPAQCLEQGCLLELARAAGHRAALRQRAAVGALRFAWHWLTAWLRLGTVQYPAWLRARLGRDIERTLGRRCDLAFAQGFLYGPSVKRVFAPNDGLQAARTAPAGHDGGPQRGAPVYILRSGEPTAVMDISPIVLGANKLPSH